jgi:hypothetical protein
MDDLLWLYRYDGTAVDVRCDTLTGKDIVMNGKTYNGHLHLTGDVHKKHLVQDTGFSKSDGQESTDTLSK